MNDNQDGAEMRDEHAPASEWCTGAPDEAAAAHAALAVNEAAGRGETMEYEFVQDYDGVEHVVRRPGAAFEHVPVCNDLDTPLFDGPEPEMCDGCKRSLAVHGDPALLAAAVAGSRARWMACLLPLADEQLASRTAD